MQNELPDSVAQNIQAFVDAVDADVTAEDVGQEVLNQYEEHDELSGDTRWQIAFKKGRKAAIDSGTGSASGGDGEMFSIITIGHGRVSQWPHRNHENFQDGMSKDAMPRKDVLIANGIAINEEKGRANLAVFAFDSTNENVDIEYAMEAFSEPMNALTARFSPAAANDYPDGLILYSTDSTELEEIDNPMPMDERKDLVGRFVDDVTVASLDDVNQSNLSMSSDRGAVDFGIDVKRISGATIWDHWVSDDDYGRYNFLDDSIMAPQELEGTPLDTSGDDFSCRGFTGWAHSNLMDYDDDSIVDFYGVVTENREGNVTMDIRGIDPIHAESLDDGGVALGSQTSESF